MCRKITTGLNACKWIVDTGSYVGEKTPTVDTSGTDFNREFLEVGCGSLGLVVRQKNRKNLSPSGAIVVAFLPLNTR